VKLYSGSLLSTDLCQGQIPADEGGCVETGSSSLKEEEMALQSSQQASSKAQEKPEEMNTFTQLGNKDGRQRQSTNYRLP